MRRGIVCLALAVCLLLGGCAREPRRERFQAVWLDVFDTVTVFTAYQPSQEAFDRLAGRVHAELTACHRLFDIYNAYEGVHNLKTVNDAAGREPVAVDARVLDLVGFGVAMHAATGGRVNIAMGAVLALWHEARALANEDPERAYVPGRAALEAAAAHTDIANVIVDREAGTVFLADPELRLDVGAIAKGWAAQRVCDLLREEGVTGVCLSAGGNIATIGAKAKGEKWTIAVEDPFGGEDYADMLALSDLAAVTSGTYERYFTVDGLRYHHIIDPETLFPSEKWASVTILAGDSARADALSTALFNLDGPEALALAEAEGVEALLIAPDGARLETEGFAAFREG